MLFGISKKKHAAAVLEFENAVSLLGNQVEQERNRAARNLNQLIAEQDKLQEAHRMQRLAQVQREEAECRAQEAQQRAKESAEQLATLSAMHATRIRIGSVNIDPIELTSRLRGTVNSGLRVEWDGQKLVIYGNRELTEPELNQLKSVLAARRQMLNPRATTACPWAEAWRQAGRR